MVASNGTLVLLPSLRAVVGQDGRFGLTQKFVDGMAQWVEHWGGPVRVVMEPVTAKSTDLDHVLVDPARLPFSLAVTEYTSSDFDRHIEDAAVVAGSCSYRQNHLADRCRSMSIPCVYGAEYTLSTRLQIIDADTSNPLLRARRYWWEWQQERRQVAAIRRATGIQCNGTPTYDAYRSINPQPFLFFDTRTTRDILVTPDALERRLLRLKGGSPLRLAFSGRLEPMKGVDHLPRIAQELSRLGVPFHLSIFGDGRLRSAIETEIKSRDLNDKVEMRGAVRFRDELVPWIRENVDVFVCPHVQGDPSCTYLETFACGVPIAGFGNEAFRGLLARVPAGWSAPIKDARKLALILAELDRDRDRIREASRAALDFARENTVELTFERRAEHLRECAARRPVSTSPFERPQETISKVPSSA